MSVTSLVRRTTSTGQSALLVVLPHGGQNLARRNCWAAMSVDAGRAQARREAATAMSCAVSQHGLAASG